jgi:hypothetical protein
MVAWKVSSAVNSPKHNNTALLEPQQQLAAHQPSVHVGDEDRSMTLPRVDREGYRHHWLFAATSFRQRR